MYSNRLLYSSFCFLSAIALVVVIATNPTWSPYILAGLALAAIWLVAETILNLAVFYQDMADKRSSRKMDEYRKRKEADAITTKVLELREIKVMTDEQLQYLTRTDHHLLMTKRKDGPMEWVIETSPTVRVPISFAHSFFDKEGEFLRPIGDYSEGSKWEDGGLKRVYAKALTTFCVENGWAEWWRGNQSAMWKNKAQAMYEMGFSDEQPKEA